MGGLNSKQIADIKKGKTDVLIVTNQRRESLQKKFYTLTSTKTWNLSNNFLNSISPKISSLFLSTLDLSSNEFFTFPVEICKLPSLATLDLSYNFIAEIPPEVQQLLSLTELNLSFNRITDLHEIGKISSLRVLKASNNYISKIPDSFVKLHHINLLSLVHNNISSLPKFTLNSLESFHISSNQITHIPFTFLCQPKLHIISLSRNKLHSFPPPIQNPGLNSNLREIYISNNGLVELTTNIYHFPKLEILDLKANQLSEIPFELFVHSPLIHTLDLSFNPGCRWGMHMPNTFAPPPLIRDIHLSKKQCMDIGRSLIAGHVNSDSEGADSDSPNSPIRRPASPSLAALSRSPTPSPTSSPATSPSSSPSTPRRAPFAPEQSTTTTTTIATTTARMTTTVITADATDTQIIAPKTGRRSQLGRLGPDEQRDGSKRKHSHKHVKNYVHNKKQFRLVEHDHSVWDQAVVTHASHLADLLVWSGAPCANVEDAIYKVLLDITQIRPGLFLSSKDALHAKNITHILIVGAELHPAFPSEFEYYSVSVRDNAIIDDLSIYFPICQKFIETGIKKGGVLVHCAAGSSRSASCVMAYLMWKENMSFNEARKELRALRPIVKTNFYLQLEFYEGILRSQSKRKAKASDASSKPKLVRSASLPTIDAVHAFQIEKTREEAELEERTRTLPIPISSHLRSSDSQRPASRTDADVATKSQSAPQPTQVHSGKNLHRASRSLYSDLRVSLPGPDSPTFNTVREEPEEVVKNQEGNGKDEVEGKREKEGEGAGAEVREGQGKGKNKSREKVGTKEPEREEMIGEGVPNSVIRQASDFEEISEIHQLMRVHSLQEIVVDEEQKQVFQRKLSRGKSFLKHSKINLLDLDESP